MNNNPVRYNDPSGHRICEDDIDICGKTNSKPNKSSNKVFGDGSDYILGVKLKLTKEQTADLLVEINWWLDKLEAVNDVLTSPLGVIAGYAGAAGVVALVVAPTTPPAVAAAVIGVPTFVASVVTGNTIGDLQDIRYAVAMASRGGEQGVEIDMGQNIGSWGISVNGQEIVKHAELGQYLPAASVFTPKGSYTLTKVWFAAWYLFDYGK
jgi:hypothetical protein